MEFTTIAFLGLDLNSIKYTIAFKQSGRGGSHLVPFRKEELTPAEFEKLAEHKSPAFKPLLCQRNLDRISYCYCRPDRIEYAIGKPGPPNIAAVDITPFVTGSNPIKRIRFASQTATIPNTPRIPQDLSRF